MKIKNFVSILIINYNNAKFLDRAIYSCINQTYKNIEILIFDDKSTDRSKLILKQYNKNKKIKYFINKSKKLDIPAFDAKNAYYNLINKCKGEIIFLLDSDDYFEKDKVFKIIKKFNSDKKINFVQDMPKIILNNKKSFVKKNKNNLLSFWPYFAPASCISFRKKFIKKFVKSNLLLEDKYLDVWLDFRLGVFSYYVDNSFYSLNENFTIYKPYGESKKYPLFGKKWFKRRFHSYQYLNKITSGKFNFILSFDFVITNIIYIIFNCLQFNKKKDFV